MDNWARPAVSRRNRCAFYRTLLLLFTIPVCHAILVNRTIDSNKGDPVTGFVPIYQPQSPWDDQTCSGCYIQPDVAKAYDGTWNAATYHPQLQNVNFTLRFTGVALWVFFVLSNANSRSPGTTTNTQVNVTLDGQHVGTFSHTPDLTTEDLIYNATIFSASGLSNTPHEVVIATNDYPISTFINFDWAIYTVEMDASAPPSQITFLSTSSTTTVTPTTNSISTPTNITSFASVHTTSSTTHSIPSPTPSTPSTTNSMPSPTPSAPATTNSMPSPTPSAPATTNSMPSPTPSAPATTNSMPSPTPSAPATTNSKPSPTPSAPATTNSKPSPTPSAPATTNSMPSPTSTPAHSTPSSSTTLPKSIPSSSSTHSTPPIPTQNTSSATLPNSMPSPTPTNSTPSLAPTQSTSPPTPPHSTSSTTPHSTFSTTLDPQAPQSASPSIGAAFPSTTNSFTVTTSSSTPTPQSIVNITVGCTLGGLAIIVLVLLFFVRRLLRALSVRREAGVLPHTQPDVNPQTPVQGHLPQAARLREARHMEIYERIQSPRHDLDNLRSLRIARSTGGIDERIQSPQRAMDNLNSVRSARSTSDVGSPLAAGLPAPPRPPRSELRNEVQRRGQIGTLQAQQETNLALGLSDEPLPPAYSPY